MTARALWAIGSGQVIFNSGLDALANNALVLSNVITPFPSGALFADFGLEGTFSSGAPTANTGISVWLLRQTRSGFWETGSSGVTPTRNIDVSFGFASNQSGQAMVQPASLPPLPFKILLKNDGTGQSMAPSGNIFYMTPNTIQQY